MQGNNQVTQAWQTLSDLAQRAESLGDSASIANQQQVAQAILAGVRNYFASNPPPGTLMAKSSTRQHVIRRGDTLSHIAQRYGVSMNTLRSTNKLKNDNLLVGKVLTIPASDG